MLGNLGLAKWMSARWHRLTGAPFDELLSSAHCGLVRAADSYDEARSKFGTWAGLWIRAEFQHLASVRRRHSRDWLVLDEPYDEDEPEGKTRKDLVAGDEDTEQLALHEAEKKIARGVLRLVAPRDRKILLRRAEGLGLREVGEEFGISGERVRQIERAAMRRLRLYANVRA